VLAKLGTLLDPDYGQTPRPSTSRPVPGHKVYPYLLKDVVIEGPNQVSSSDITYIPMRRGFLYLVAMIDCYSPCVLSWKLSNSMDVELCLEALDNASAQGTPELFNTDQGAQFISRLFTDRLNSNSIEISMDGRGRT
jgi:putative transposase